MLAVTTLGVAAEVLVKVLREMLMSVAGMTSVPLESTSAAPILTVTFGGLVRVPVVLAESALVLVVRVAEPSAVG
jgi:hypothetical protein